MNQFKRKSIKKQETEPNREKKMSMIEIKFRKKKLEDDLDKLESGFKDRAQKIQSIIPSSINPIDSIRKRPFRSLGIAIAAGLVLGLSSSKKKRSGSGDEVHSYSTSHSSGFTSLLMDELKRLAAHRAASYISDLIDQRANQNNR